MIRKFIPIVMFAFVLASSSCGTDTADDGTTTPNNNTSTGTVFASCAWDGGCNEYTGSSSDAAAIEAYCTSEGSTYTANVSCSVSAEAATAGQTASALGYCSITDSTGSVPSHNAYDYSTPDTAQAGCAVIDAMDNVTAAWTAL